MSKTLTLEQRITELECAIQDALAFIENFSDVVDGDDGQPEPNEAMSLVTYLESFLKN